MTEFSNPQIIPHLQSSVNFTLFDCQWVPCSTRFVVLGAKLNGEGILCTYSMTPKELTKLDEVIIPKSFRCSTFGATTLEERHLSTGDFAGDLKVWDLEDISKPIRSISAHEKVINAIDGAGGLGSEGAPEIATASRDGTVKVWDLRVKDRPVACMEPKSQEMCRDAWAVAFGDSHSDSDRVLVTGYDNGDIKMFDLRTMSLRWETRVSSGVCHLEFDRKDIKMNKLVASCLEGKTHVWNMRTFHKKKGYSKLQNENGKATIWRSSHLPQNRDVFMCASGSGSLSLWKYNNPDKTVIKDDDNEEEGVVGSLEILQETQIGDQPIGSFAWSSDKLGLGLCTGFDQKIQTIIVTKLNTL